MAAFNHVKALPVYDPRQNTFRSRNQPIPHLNRNLIRDALCSWNSQNVKLRLVFVEIWWFYRHSDFTRNPILMNSNQRRLSHDFSEFCISVTRISVIWALVIQATTYTIWGKSDQTIGLTLIQILQAMLPTFSKISWLYCKHSETQIKYSVKIYLSFVKYFHFEMIKKCTIVKRNSKLVMKLQ